MLNKEIKEYLQKEFPNARPGFIEVLVEALELHEKKNNDYNGDKPLFPATAYSLFHDLKRKFGRLYNQLEGKREMQVNETLMDTVIDLGNYSFLMVEELRRENLENHI